MKIDIANNIKTVELLKVELLQKLTDFCGDMAAEPDCESLTNLTSDAAGIINIVYLIAMRLGLDTEDIKEMMIRQLDREISNNHLIEKRYGDLSHLRQFLEG